MRRSPLLLGILTALGACSDDPDPASYEDEGCLTVEESVASCAPAGEVSLNDLYLPGQCGLDIVGVKGEGERKSVTGDDGVARPSCCYTVDVVDPDPRGECVVGRPYREGGVLRQAGLEAPHASRRAEAWARAGAGEHASVAAFARLALQLMAHGAPLDLLGAVHDAARDEVRHAEICWDMARSLGAAVQAPGPFPFGEPIEAACSLFRLAVEATREGCIAETLAAHAASAAADLAPEAEVRAALRSIAEDEARHAALSYRIVRWALRKGEPSLSEAVRAVFEEEPPRIDTRELALRAGVDEGVLLLSVRSGPAEILRPAARALLAA